MLSLCPIVNALSRQGKMTNVCANEMIILQCLFIYYCFTDAPKFVSNQTMYYSWEGNPINISCDVKSNPPASIHWRREKLVLPAKNTTHLKTYSVGRKMILEVSLWEHRINIFFPVFDYVRIYLI